MNKIDFLCPICNSDRFEVKYEDTIGEKLPIFNYDFGISGNKTYRIAKCNNCTHHFATPRHKNIYVNYDSNIIDEIYLKLQPQRNLTDENRRPY